MRTGAVYFALLLLAVHHAHSTYVALAPSKFFLGWTYKVPVRVSGTSNGLPVTVEGRIQNSRNDTLQSGTVTINDGELKTLEIAVSKDFRLADDNQYKLRLLGSGGLTFENTTTIKLDFASPIVFVQTDRKMYKPKDKVHIRALIVNEDLIPQNMAKTISIKNAAGATLETYQDDGTKAVFEATYQLLEKPGLGDWTVHVNADNGDIKSNTMFTVEEFVAPKFEVSAYTVPKFLLSGEKGTNAKVRLMVTGTYTYGKGVMGDVLVKVGKTTQTGQIINSNGKTEMLIDLSIELEKIRHNGMDGIPIYVNVTNENALTYGTKVKVSVYPDPVKMEFDKSVSDAVFRSNMPLKLAVKVTDPEGQALQDRSRTVTMMLTNNQDWSVTNQTTVINQTSITLAAGKHLAVWDIGRMPATGSIYDFNASITENGKTIEVRNFISKYQTLGNTTLDARWKTYSPMLAMGSTATFTVSVSSPADFTSYNYLIVSRGNIQSQGSAVVGDNSLKVTTEMCPNGRLVVYGITSGAQPEIIADSLDLKLEQCQSKKVMPTVDKKAVKTGSNASISVGVTWTDPSQQAPIGQHDIYMLAVDKSILLMKGDNDITPDRVQEALQKYDLSEPDTSGPVWFREKRSIMPFPPRNNQPTSTGELFQGVGLAVLADVEMKAGYRYHPYYKNELGGGGEEWDRMEQDEGSEATGGAVAPTVTVVERKNFPDTFIWKKYQTDANGRLVTLETVPDTITSWIISAFAVRDNTPLAVTADPFQLNAVNPFFATLNLPYSIRRTEIFELRVTIFNYQNYSTQATVTLEPSDGFTIKGGNSKSTVVTAGAANSVTFSIEATKVKTIELKVTSVGTGRGGSYTDIVTKQLIVKPEGVEKRYAISVAPVLSSDTPTFDKNVTFQWPANISQQSQMVQVKITGDLMGNTLNNIEDLVSQPTGCGEQTMISTVPNIYALTYSRAIRDSSSEFEVKAKGFMAQGYKRETTGYRHSGGGYSAWGNKDPSASTWLTAFVVRSFAQAREFIPETVDDSLLGTDMDFMLGSQNNNGSFSEKGEVVHKDMQGGTGGQALSVYVTMAMLEAKKYGMQVNPTKLKKGVDYVKTIAASDLVRSKQFVAAITAYTLTLDDAVANRQTVERLLGYITNDNQAPWLKTQPAEPSSKMVSYHHQAGPSDIEITAYYVLALIGLGRGQEKATFTPVQWLQQQQNDRGGFGSTQDTVMALQAISIYSAGISSFNQQFTVTVTPLAPAGAAVSYTITPVNKRMLRIIRMPDTLTMARVVVTGPEGSMCVVKFAFFCHVTSEAPPSTNNNFDITGITQVVKPKVHKVKTCITKDPNMDYTGMVYMDFIQASGFKLESLQDAERNNDVTSVEENEDKVVFYMREPKNTCLQFNVEEVVSVENRKSAHAKVFAYYDPAITAGTAVNLEACPAEGCISSKGTQPNSLAPILLSAALCLLLSLLLAM